MSLAAVILNYNDYKTTIDAATRLGGFSCVDHVVIVDNASTDSSAEKIAEALRDGGLSEKTTLIRSEHNGGYGSGNNLGVGSAHDTFGSTHVLIANPDADVPEETVQKMLGAFSADPNIAAVGAVMRSGSAADITYEEYTAAGWCFRNLLKEVLHSGPVCKRIFRSILEYPFNYYKKAEETPVYAVHGSLLMVSADDFLAAGGYDPEMFLYMEEYTLGWKLKKAGKKTVLVSAPYQHAGSHSITGAGLNAVRRQRIRQESERIYYRKYLGAGPVSMALIRIFQGIVLLETMIAAMLGKL